MPKQPWKPSSLKNRLCFSFCSRPDFLTGAGQTGGSGPEAARAQSRAEVRQPRRQRPSGLFLRLALHRRPAPRFALPRPPPQPPGRGAPGPATAPTGRGGVGWGAEPPCLPAPPWPGPAAALRRRPAGRPTEGSRGSPAAARDTRGHRSPQRAQPSRGTARPASL